MRILITIYCLYITSANFFSIQAQSKLKGRVTDEQGFSLAFASVYDLGTSNGTLTNEEGYFELELSPGEHTVAFQFLGYRSVSKKISMPYQTELIITMVPEEFKMSEIEILAGEDPAVEIMRKAIARRSFFYQNFPAYKAELYIKALMKIVDAPHSFMGQKLGSMDGILDSARQGILYFSESISAVSFDPTGKYKEELVSSKVSGEDRGISVNQFSYANFNFYRENIHLFRELVSPLADNAFQFYRFYLYDQYEDELGNLVYKIKVKPNSGFRPCFSGFIHINDSLFNLNKLDLSITGTAIKNPVLDTIHIRQVFVPVAGGKYWPLITQHIEFQVSIFSFKSRGNFNYIFKNYDLNPVFEKKHFGSEVFKVKDDAIKNDSTFWSENRPIPLTIEEARDYVRKDSIARVISSPTYMDSVDRANNKFKWGDILFGYTATQSSKKRSYGITAPLSTFQFNAVEGTNFSLRPFTRKSNADGYNVYNIKGEVRYGFVDKSTKWHLDSRWNYDIKNQASIRLKFGKDYYQYNEAGLISPLGNTFYSLTYKYNVARLFEKKFIEGSWGMELFNGFSAGANISFAHRRDLDNRTNFSWFRKSWSYAPNNPQNLPDSDFNFSDRIFKHSITLKWTAGQKYQTYPGYKVRMSGGWPTLYLTYEKAIALKSGDADFTRLKFTLIDNHIALRIFGYLLYSVEGGTFLGKPKLQFADYFHFKGNDLVGGFRSPYLQTFKLQTEYAFSSQNAYVAGWMEHHFDGFIFDKIPLVNKLGITGIVSCAGLIRSDLKYIEPGIGIEGIKIGVIDVMRIDYFWSFANGTYKDQGIRLGFSTFFENIFGLD
ncbi:MAG: carboxypeptidase-like regulatory domain-containing protein [Saprospiraceae bacterium]|nr:carboxypeptidase-like regulatory domain-containing protein [Saprospiraceae bacterium]